MAEFDLSLTYPANLNVGRSERPQEPLSHYWRGRALEALHRLAEARAAWQTGAAGPPAPIPDPDLLRPEQLTFQNENRRNAATRCRPLPRRSSAP